jgi:hypothetical protein
MLRPLLASRGCCVSWLCYVRSVIGSNVIHSFISIEINPAALCPAAPQFGSRPSECGNSPASRLPPVASAVSRPDVVAP